MTFFLLTSAFFLVWTALGFFALAWWHDRAARRPYPANRIRWWHLFLGGPLVWLNEAICWWTTRQIHRQLRRPKH
jgi:hypothetical protein